MHKSRHDTIQMRQLQNFYINRAIPTHDFTKYYLSIILL